MSSIENNTKWSSLRTSINKVLQQEKHLSLYYFNQICKNWQVVFTGNVANNILPMRIHKQKLEIITEDGSYANYVRLRKNIILSNIRAILQSNFCKDIKIVIKTIEPKLLQYVKNCQKTK